MSKFINISSRFDNPNWLNYKKKKVENRWKWTSCSLSDDDEVLRPAAVGAGSGETGSGGGGDAEVLSSSLDRAWNRWANCDTLAPAVLHAASSPFAANVYNAINRTKEQRYIWLTLAWKSLTIHKRGNLVQRIATQKNTKTYKNLKRTPPFQRIPSDSPQIPSIIIGINQSNNNNKSSTTKSVPNNPWRCNYVITLTEQVHTDTHADTHTHTHIHTQYDTPAVNYGDKQIRLEKAGKSVHLPRHQSPNCVSLGAVCLPPFIQEYTSLI